MGWFSSKHLMSVFLIVVLVQTEGHKACLEEERMGLQELKSFVKSNINEDAVGPVLGSWVDDKESDCCEWERVNCNSVTGRVTKLSLSNIRQLDEDQGQPWSLNTSLFLPFQELMSLNLSQNGFEGCLENEGFERLSSLKMLEVLDLGRNGFNETILPSLGTLTSLRALTLRETHVWEGLSCPFNELASLTNLKMLDLGGFAYLELSPVQDFGRLSSLKMLQTLVLDSSGLNNSILPYLSTLTSLKKLDLSNNDELSGSFPPAELTALVNLEILDVSWSSLDSFTGFVGFNKLKVLDLSNNWHSNEGITGFIWNLSSLQELSLSGNQIIGSLPVEGFCRMEKLQKLDLSHNRFDGMVPSCLWNFKFLRYLDISDNMFTGNVPSSLIINLTSLEYINLGNNYFTGLFSFSSFANLQNLEVVVLSDNNFEVEIEYTSWVSKFQLKVLGLSHCNLNKRTRDVTQFLSRQVHLQQIDLSHNNLKEDLPNWMLQNHTRLEYLILTNNSFTGKFPLLSYPKLHLLVLDISKNHFSGLLPEKFGEMFPDMEFFNLAENAFEGRIPASISNMSNLVALDLSSNDFSEEVTTELIVVPPYLQFLKLSNNRLHGFILSTEFSQCSLFLLLLDNNQFTGSVSDGLYNCSSLEILDIGNNKFSGEIPRWINNMTSLRILFMQNNSLSGFLPPSLLNGSLEHILLQGNELMGSIPIPKHLPNPGVLNTLRSIPRTNHLPNPGVLHTLDLGGNNLSGKIPKSLSKFFELNILSLRGNNFIGHIPNSLCQLSKISILDLSNNRLSGPIPSCFNNMTFRMTNFDDFYNDQLIIALPHTYTDPIIQTDLASDLVSKEAEYHSQIEVKFTTKARDNIYKGDILTLMFGLDLSSNNLIGEIPYELGHLTSIHALNLSHNWLTGSIPKGFSKLSQLESLDLSYNKLSGQIPPQLTDLNFLSAFIVAHNNFSGRIPDMKAQFGTFDESSYEGNPFLCGSMIKRECDNVFVDDHPPAIQSDENEGKWYDIDLTIFSASFIASYLTILLVFIVLLYINPYWRRRWFFLIEESLYSCYYFSSNVIYKFSAFWCK